MENYYKQKAELELAEEMLNSKLEEKEIIYLKYFGKNGTDDINASIKGVATNHDQVAPYLIELEKRGLDKEIEYLQNEVRIKKYYLKRMELILSGLKGIEYEFLKLRYFEERNYTLEEIAIKLNYSIRQLKRISARVEEKIREHKK